MKIFSSHPKLEIIYSVVEDNIDCFYDEYWDEFTQQTEYKTFHSFVVAKEWEKETARKY